MSLPPESRQEAIARLNRSASDLEARTATKTNETLAASAVTGEAYKIIAELIGGVVVGLALGFGVDRVLGTNPWGLIGGVLVGFAISIWMARRTANRLMAKAKAIDPVPAGETIVEGRDEDERER